MNNTPAYRPEDMEALLLQKSFGELYAEEKKFVLEHLESEVEYERMRKLLQGIHAKSFSLGDPGTPNPAQRDKLLDAFAAEQRNKRKVVLWNFTLPQFWRWENSGFRYAMGIVVLFMAALFTLKTTQNDKPELVKQNNDTVIPQQIVKQPAPEPENKAIKETPVPAPPANVDTTPKPAPQPQQLANVPKPQPNPQPKTEKASRTLAEDAAAMGLFYTAL